MSEFKSQDWQPTPLPLNKPFGEPMPEKPKPKANDREQRGSIIVNGDDEDDEDDGKGTIRM